MRIYQPTKSEYTIPSSIYYRMIFLIRDYPRMIEEADAMLEATPPQTETPEIQRQRNIKAQETMNLKYSMILQDIRDIEESLMGAVPPDARTAIMKSIIYGERYPTDRDRKTYGRYKQKFVHDLAERKRLL